MNPAGLHGSYDANDVLFLLKPLDISFTPVAEKERLIQTRAKHYSEMISPEFAPDQTYMDIYRHALLENGPKLAQHINTLADELAQRSASGARLAIVSLVRAGTPIGVLLNRALRRRGRAATHYSVSIIRGRGIDLNAMRSILRDHAPSDVIFVDGWTGKGAIAGELRSSRGAIAAGVEPFLTVVADPAGCADLAATGEDYLIPSGILNGIVSGLVSRSILNDQIGDGDFHGCKLLTHLIDSDVTRDFVEQIDGLAREVGPQMTRRWSTELASDLRDQSRMLIEGIANRYQVSDLNRLKPGIAESTRAVLRRVPERLLISDHEDSALKPLLHLANERGVLVELMATSSVYKAIALITSGSDA
ncbi:cysteine protease StiP domain-containing protein [Brevundimonas diminuta]|uniref:cysteine protease StiP domain-containing protein n=1 Tax=Brevundimonas diminuta TaxID=293 RepID=UPI001F593840|nr:cysteine protease StiP domain-containing protein [Brevundimonas diminuta]